MVPLAPTPPDVRRRTPSYGRTRRGGRVKHRPVTSAWETLLMANPKHTSVHNQPSHRVPTIADRYRRWAVAGLIVAVGTLVSIAAAVLIELGNVHTAV